MVHTDRGEHSEPQDGENESEEPNEIESKAEPAEEPDASAADISRTEETPTDQPKETEGAPESAQVQEAGVTEIPIYKPLAAAEPPESDGQRPPTQGDPRRRRRRILISVAIVILALVGSGGAAAYYIIYVQLSSTPEYTARFLPSNTAIYMSVNLRPGVGQLNQVRKIMARFRENRDFQDPIDDLTDDFDDETGIQLFDDVLPWLGPELSVGVLNFDNIEDFDNSPPDTVMFVQTSDPDATEDFLRDMMDYFEDELGEEFDRGRSRGFTTYSYQDQYSDFGMHFVVTEEYLVIATSEGLLNRTLTRMETPSRSLAEKDEFIQMQAAAGNRFAFLYVDVDSIARDIRSSLSDYDLDLWNEVEDQLPESIATAASFIDMGIKVTTTYRTPRNAFTVSGTNTLGSADYLPSDTLAFMSITGVAEIWAQTRDQLEDAFESSLDFRRALRDFERETGIDIDRDIFHWMTGELSLALLPSEFTLDRYEDIDDVLIHAVALIEFERLADAEDGLYQIIDALEDEGLFFDEVDVGDEVALLADLSREFDVYDYEPGYVILRDRVVFGTTRESLEDVMDVRGGARRSLADDPEYRKFIDTIGSATDVVFYANVAEIIEMILDALGPSDRADYEDDVAPFVDPIRVLAIGSDVNEETVTVTVLISFE